MEAQRPIGNGKWEAGSTNNDNDTCNNDKTRGKTYNIFMFGCKHARRRAEA